jgi:hypothetical protein
MSNDLLFYDIEVFKEDSLVVFKNIDKTIAGIFHNDFEGIYALIKDKTLVGYNNYFYDDFILTAMLDQWTPYQIKELNDKIISGERQKHVHRIIKSIDCFQQIDVARPSLKKIEANMGMSIVESEIDFTIDRKLTEEELESTIFYCSHDVDATIEIYKQRESQYFKPKEMLLEMLDNPHKKAYRWNTTTIASNVLVQKRLPMWSDIRLGEYNKNGDYEMLDIVPPEVVQLWRTKEKGKYKHEEFGCKIEFGFGGLHGVNSDENKIFKDVKLLDVGSMYPNIILLLKGLDTSTEIYREIVEKRLDVKAKAKIEKKKPKEKQDKELLNEYGILSDSLKLIINSTYGLLNNEYSTLKNPNVAKSVCFFGQISLYDLAKRLSEHAKIVNINTDGVAFVSDNEHYKTIWKEWEQDYGLNLDLDEYDLFIQRDVNNYIAVEKSGKIKTKGGDVTRYNGDAYFKNNTCRIVDIAIVNKMVYGKDVLTTIQENLDNPRLFQVILQAGRTFKGTFDENGKQYNKVNRVFPVKKDGVLLQKKRMDDGLVHFPDAPSCMLVWNEDLSDFKDFKKVIDINYYYQLINKKLERWE